MTSETERRATNGPAGGGRIESAGPAGPASGTTRPDGPPGTGDGGAVGTTARPISILDCPNCGKKNRITPSSRGVPHCGSCDEPLPWLVNATDATFDVEANASVAVLVDLWAPWCGPCRYVGPILEQIAREYAGRIKVVKVNVDENPQTAQRFEAYSIPTLVVLRGGRPVDRIVGAMPKQDLVIRLTPHLLRR
ncbi:MAG TPA: thioredoxin [Candidatus Limnocylindrales bacterium]|nr:thioredoxin [Candidatus Limnocylindrales bacterium]